jgi:hypothetical protein
MVLPSQACSLAYRRGNIASRQPGRHRCRSTRICNRTDQYFRYLLCVRWRTYQSQTKQYAADPFQTSHHFTTPCYPSIGTLMLYSIFSQRTISRYRSKQKGRTRKPASSSPGLWGGTKMPPQPLVLKNQPIGAHHKCVVCRTAS